jgi:hypothetical protein
MKEGPLELRGRLQPAMSRFVPMGAVVNVVVNRRDYDCVMYG